MYIHVHIALCISKPHAISETIQGRQKYTQERSETQRLLRHVRGDTPSRSAHAIVLSFSISFSMAHTSYHKPKSYQHSNNVFHWNLLKGYYITDIDSLTLLLAYSKHRHNQDHTYSIKKKKKTCTHTKQTTPTHNPHQHWRSIPKQCYRAQHHLFRLLRP